MGHNLRRGLELLLKLETREEKRRTLEYTSARG